MPEVPKLNEPYRYSMTPSVDAAWAAKCVDDKRRERAYAGEGKAKVVLTRERLNAGKSSRGAFNKRQMTILGEFPLRVGWWQRIEGLVISTDLYTAFLRCRTIDGNEQALRQESLFMDSQFQNKIASEDS